MIKIMKKTFGKDDYKYDFSFVPKKDMKEFLKRAKKNWKDAIKKSKINEYFKDYILNEKVRGRLAEFMKKELKIDKKSEVLDIGSGMGALTIALARRFKTVGTDVNPSTLEFIKHRAEQEKINLALFHISPLHKGLPFKKESFDVVLMNGVLEWVAFKIEGDVKKIQEKVLKNIFRILKKNGIFILAIENRLALDWFKGKTSHIPIKYVDLLPRKIADFVCKIKRGKKFRTYIYSKFGYEKMLKKVGFRDVEFYEAYPNYQKPKWIKKTNNLFANSFIIVCKKI